MRRRSLVFVSLAFAVVAAVPSPAAARVPCGVLEPVDVLLHCDARPSAAAAGVPARAVGEKGEEEPQAKWSGAGGRVDPNRLLVRFATGTSRLAAARAARLAGGSLERRLTPLGLDVVHADAARLEQVRAALLRSRIVRSIHDERLIGLAAVQPNDAHWPSQKGLHLARFAEAWEATTGSAAAVVAVVDTGVDASHPDLAASVLTGRDVLRGDDDASDDHGHGTAVAGIVAARANNAIGIAGVCWRCRVLPVKALGADGAGPTSAVAAGILWATDNGADVINLSLGSPLTTPALAAAVDYAVARGLVVVAAAGNDGVAAPFYPAADQNALAVAATDERDRAYSWSNFGPWVELAAPGCLPTTLRVGGYGVECGTSIAAPVVAGLAGLALSMQPELSPAAVAGLLRRGAVPVGTIVNAGRIDAARTVAGLASAAGMRTTLTVRSTLTRTHPERVFAVRGAGGTWAVNAAFRGHTRATVSIVDARRRAVARMRGRSPVRVVRRLPAGVYRVRVTEARGAFTVTVTRPRASAADAARAVRLSEIAEVDADAPGAFLGRPAVAQRTAAFAVAQISEAESAERPIAAAINRLRRSHGLRPLPISRQLARAGDSHARSLAVAGAFTHDWPLTPRASFARWIVRYYGARRARPWRAGENLLWSEAAITPEQAVAMWMNSPSHREILLASDWRELGIGVVRARGAGGLFAGRDVYLVAAEFGAR